jgi:hypothetical protein
MFSAPRILQLKIHLLGISPMIWRRVLVSSSITLRELHGILQVAVGWDGIHLFQFDIRTVDYGSWELYAANPDIPLSGFGFRRNDRLSYIYDMGDYWKHEVRVEAVLDADPKKSYPVFTGGAGACPPEECGGPQGYLARRDEASGYDAWQDLETLASFGQDLLDRHDTGRTLEDLALDDLEYVLDRMKAREPYLETSFSRRDVNTQLRDGRHRELMHQQLM